jgi:hypothetical protein
MIGKYGSSSSSSSAVKTTDLCSTSFTSYNNGNHAINIELILKKFQDIDQYLRKYADESNLILVIGGTGSGKSTIINYLAGQTMREITKEEFLEPVIEADNPIMAVGHDSFRSLTDLPQLYSDSNTKLTYCDCPGFSDTRGAEVDIANGYAIKSIIENARSIKAVLVIVNYHALYADKGRSVKETLMNLNQLFGGKDAVSRHRASIKIIISKGHMDDMVTLESLRALLLRDTEINEVIPLENLYFYDPLDRLDVIKRGALPRDQMLKMIRESAVIKREYLNNIKCVFSDSSLLALYDLTNKIFENAYLQFDAGNFSRIQELFEFLDRILVFNDCKIGASIALFTATILNKVKALASDEHNYTRLENIKRYIPCCAEFAEATMKIIKTRIEKTKEDEKGKGKAECATADAKQQTVVAVSELRSYEQKIAVANKAKESADHLTQEYIKLLEELQRDIEYENQRGPQVIEKTFVHGHPGGGGLKRIFGGLFSGVVTGLTTGNPLLGLASGIKSAIGGNTHYGNDNNSTNTNINAIPLPSFNYKSHNVTVANNANSFLSSTSTSSSSSVSQPPLTAPVAEKVIESNPDTSSSWVAKVLGGAASGAIDGGAAGFISAGPAGILPGALVGAGIGAVSNTVGQGVEDYATQNKL